MTDRTELVITDDATKDFMALVKQARAAMVIDAEEVSPKAAPLALPRPALGDVVVSAIEA